MATERILAKLWANIEQRRSDPPVKKSSQRRHGRDMPFDTRDLLQSPSKLRKKLNEETYELNEAHQALLADHEVEIGVQFGARDHVAREAADVLYHVYVLLASVDVTPKEVYAVVERRLKKELERERRRVLAESEAAAAPDEGAGTSGVTANT
jgi:phosphoribosyl-ATP pyrophosphohydrolase